MSLTPEQREHITRGAKEKLYDDCTNDGSFLYSVIDAYVNTYESDEIWELIDCEKENAAAFLGFDPVSGEAYTAPQSEEDE